MFAFDPDKSAANLAKHGIDFEQAQALWLDDDRIEGRVRWVDEDRWMVVGKIGDRLWSAIITHRDDAIRIISVRRSRPNEAKAYGTQTDEC